MKSEELKKILIGTPIHESKDYCTEAWIENIRHLNYPADLLLVDNSPTPKYVEKLKKYLKKHGLKNSKIVHLDLPLDKDRYERIARSREVIRNEVLDKGYYAWFSWENDQLIPPETLDELVKTMNVANFDIVEMNSWDRVIEDLPNYDWGVALINSQALKQYSFILQFGTDPDMPETWEPGEAWFRKRVLRGGGSVVDIDGVVGPIYHLDKPPQK